MVKRLLVYLLIAFLFGVFLGYKNGYRLGFKDGSELVKPKEHLTPHPIQQKIDTVKIVIPDSGQNKSYSFRLPNQVQVEIKAPKIQEFTYTFPTTPLITHAFKPEKPEKKGDVFIFVSPLSKNLSFGLSYKNLSFGIEYNFPKKTFSPIVGLKFAF